MLNWLLLTLCHWLNRLTAKASNVVLMGVLAARMDFPEELWQKALEQCVPPKFLELNKKAFELGKNA